MSEQNSERSNEQTNKQVSEQVNEILNKQMKLVCDRLANNERIKLAKEVRLNEQRSMSTCVYRLPGAAAYHVAIR